MYIHLHSIQGVLSPTLSIPRPSCSVKWWVHAWATTQCDLHSILPARLVANWLVVVVLTCFFTMVAGLGTGGTPARSTLVMLERTVVQDQGAWIVDYRLRHTGQTSMVVIPEAFGVKVQGWVSNSRITSHAVPRWSSLVVPHARELVAISEV